MDRLKTILTAIDFSPCSSDAFRQAARIAAWQGAELLRVHDVAVMAQCARVAQALGRARRRP